MCNIENDNIQGITLELSDLDLGLWEKLWISGKGVGFCWWNGLWESGITWYLYKMRGMWERWVAIRGCFWWFWYGDKKYFTVIFKSVSKNTS